MRVGVVSPNSLTHEPDPDAAFANSDRPWPFDALAKRASLLFDKLYLTDNLDVTCEIVAGGSALCADDANAGTLRYLIQKGLILEPQDLGYASGAALLQANIKGHTAHIHRQLLKVGNPSNNCELGEYTYVGQPDVGFLEAHDGNHPRSDKGRNDPRIRDYERRYESLLLKRNAALLRQAGIADVAIVGRVHSELSKAKFAHPVWEVVIKEIPDFDTRAPWQDVFGFRAEARTQHLVRSLRRWIRKIVAEDWTVAELEDEIRELVYEYETHLRVAQLHRGTGLLTCVISGTAELTENLVKLRLGRVAQMVSAVIDRGSNDRKAELEAPGRELALFTELKNGI
ncbi:MAG TPA: hypothetical protein VG889_00865 [Rhizomicrobium sp.]|nr:hypothetical protein [Rhizomicrobium sp.]